MRLALVCALLLGALGSFSCTPASSPIPTTGPEPPIVDAGPDPIALELCLENFSALNPDLSASEVELLFCTGPDALAPWSKSARTERLRSPASRAH
jgi:hypothetical protein